ncbi:hypothetical protein [Rhodovibrio salinarum]|uniref:Uncharacterized protein n=1 Tax=Rhodovibrio salinarum TaxID=1087 RepID=A0A934UZ71_9PROT|nr:hypothetical protein [Rhodovibrio salinarum]MBK1696104.1 hypothetical protein [Rhodovibrio salinarum]
MNEDIPRPRCIPVFRALGAVAVLGGIALALPGTGMLLGLGTVVHDTATGTLLLTLGALAGFAGAMLIGFAANLEILHDIRARQPGAPPRQERGG